MFITKIKIKIFCSVLCLLFLTIFTPYAQANNSGLTLQNYLAQVRCFNLGHAGSKLIASGAAQRVGEGRLIMKPALFAEGQYLKDSYDPDWSPIAGNSRNLQSYKLGVSQNTPYGLQGKLYYNYQHQTINGVNGMNPFLNQTEFTASSPIAELNLPLSRNFAGRETRASAKLIDSQARLTQHSQHFRNQMLMAQAESAYWRLAVARNIVGKQRESLDRAIKIQQWVSKRERLRLAEQADILQSEAAVEAKRLDIQSAINDEKLAEFDFNTLRGSCQDHVCEHLISFNQDTMANLILPDQVGIREDVRVAEQEEKIQIANAQLGIEKNKPNLDLYASYAFNGNNPSSNAAISESFTSNYPSTAIGLRLSMPLDVGRLNKDRDAYKKEIRGAKCQFKQKVYDNLRLWESFCLKVRNAKNRLAIATQLEGIQLKKLLAERDRLSYGKTTTYQVLLFEQDYANAQIARLVIQDEILELAAQLKTFGV